jgi:hypothetical protein
MTEPSLRESLANWQTGAFFLVGSAAVGLLVVSLIRGAVPTSGVVGLLSFAAGAVLFFLAASYLLYGR